MQKSIPFCISVHGEKHYGRVVILRLVTTPSGVAFSDNDVAGRDLLKSVMTESVRLLSAASFSIR